MYALKFSTSFVNTLPHKTMSTELCITVNGTEVWLQGEGDEVILMLHGWPDTRALWDGTVDAAGL
jgi:pimeloyl-ACP methyl ester carboxylesterase